jgi:hypothetical protein
MKPQQSDNPISSGTQLWFKDLSLLEESIDEYNWIEKWLEDNLLLKSVAMHFPRMHHGDKSRVNLLARDDIKNGHQRIEVRIQDSVLI